MKTLLFEDSELSVLLSKRYGYPKWMISRFLEFVPNLEGLLSEMEKKPSQYIRVNTLKIEISCLRDRLEKKGYILEGTSLPEVFAVKYSPMSLGATVEYLLGYYYIQDLASCFAVDALDLGRNQKVMDMASSPGGKTSFMAQRMENSGNIAALELNNRRLNSLLFNLNRCGVLNTCVYNIDGRKAHLIGSNFDRILLDAPCSCEGTIGRDAVRKTSHEPVDIEICSMRQVNLIRSAINLIKPGGIIVYSTCSFAPEENEIVINSILNEFEVTVLPLNRGSKGISSFGELTMHRDLEKTSRFYPHLDGTLGFYIAKLRKD